MVNNAVIIATTLKISEKLIAVTIISGGTSLPELITSSIAAFKRRSDIAIGNVIGSNIFNILLILGVSSMIGEVNYNPSFNFDLYLLTGSTILLFLIMFIGKKYELGRWKGFLLLLIYIAYVVFLVLNG